MASHFYSIYADTDCPSCVGLTENLISSNYIQASNDAPAEKREEDLSYRSHQMKTSSRQETDERLLAAHLSFRIHIQLAVYLRALMLYRFLITLVFAHTFRSGRLSHFVGF